MSPPTTISNGSSTPEMKIPINPQRASTLISQLTTVQQTIAAAARSNGNRSSTIRLVAVSKLKPASDILALHTASPTPHCHFGENYVQELTEKSRLLPRSIRWHFIGGLQSNKCQMLAREVRGLWAVESVDSVKKARLLEKGWEERERERERGEDMGREGDEEGEKLRVFVQVNTSGETSKAGVEPEEEELMALCRFIRDECKGLRLQGLMTIGALARSKATTAENENDDFVCLRRTRDRVAEELGIEGLELSMGMSEDFEGAIRMGSDEVRVGSTIFGERPPKGEAKVLENAGEEKG